MTIRLNQNGNVNNIESGSSDTANSLADLRFTGISNGNILMTLSSTGNLGVGTTSPSQRLDVVGGSLRITGGSLMATHNSNTIGSLFTTGGNIGIGTTSPRELIEIAPLTGSTSGMMLYSGAVDSGVNRLVFHHHYDPTGYKKVQLQTKATGGFGRADFAICVNTEGSSNDATFADHKLFISGTNGNVGIGTNSPNAPLQLANTAANRKIVLYEDSNNDHQYLGFGINSAVLRYQVSGTGNNHVFYAATSSTTSNELMRITGGGNVGIGTNDPSQKLHVDGHLRTASGYIGNFAGDNNYVQMLHSSFNPSSQYQFMTNTTGETYVNALNNRELYLRNNGSNTMTLVSSGNVGIGTSSPTNKLHIVPGSIRLARVNNTAQNWDIQADSDANLWFYFEGAPKGYLAWSADVGQIDFTGQHRSKSETVTDITDKVGYIVHSTGQFDNMSGNSSPTINESIPVVSLTSTINDKAVFGVISDIESDSTVREYSIGSFVSATEKEVGDQRLIINSVGEGAIWVCNANGNIENGDYITSCQVPGLGMCQADDILHNYTVAKATCSVVFSDLTQLQSKYQTRFLQEDGTIITEQEYNSMLANNEAVYIAAFIGCTYHCG